MWLSNLLPNPNFFSFDENGKVVHVNSLTYEIAAMSLTLPPIGTLLRLIPFFFESLDFSPQSIMPHIPQHSIASLVNVRSMFVSPKLTNQQIMFGDILHQLAVHVHLLQLDLICACQFCFLMVWLCFQNHHLSMFHFLSKLPLLKSIVHPFESENDNLAWWDFYFNGKFLVRR